MTFQPLGVVVMISGPGDTSEEVDVVRETIAEWNSQHSVDQGVVFVPKHFGSNTVPIYRKGTDGQAVINEQITNDSDVVIGLFKFRLGTPTPRNSQSGTVEEADLKEADCPVHVYFWNGPTPRAVTVDAENLEEFNRLESFRSEFHANNSGLYGTYTSADVLRSSIEKALWADARKLKETTPDSPAPKADSGAGDLSVTVGGSVWRAPFVGQLVEHQIGEDIRREAEWAGQRKLAVDPGIAAVLGTMPNVGGQTRRPKSEEEISAWADSVRSQLDAFDEAVAAAAASPISVKLNSDKLWEQVEIELVFTGALGVDRKDRSWPEIWTPLHVPPKSSLYATPDFQVPDTRGIGPLASHWTQDGGDVVLRLNLKELRHRRVPVEFDDAVILRVPSMIPLDRPTISYTWRASAAGTQHEWSGSGELTVVDAPQMKSALEPWLEKN